MYQPIIDAALKAVDPVESLERLVESGGANIPGISYGWLIIDGVKHDIAGRLVLLAIGKAAIGMSDGFMRAAGQLVDTGLVVSKSTFGNRYSELQYVLGDHPIPGSASLAAGEKVMSLIGDLDPEDLLVVLVSGGGSALVTAPVDGVTLDDIAAITSEMMLGGADILSLNTVRRGLDRLKGGGVVANTAAKVVALVLSDVVGDHLESVSSGPTVADPRGAERAISELEQWDLARPSVVEAIRARVGATRSAEQHVIVGSCKTAVQAAARAAREAHFETTIVTTELGGEARVAGEEFARMLCDYKGPRPACFIAGGETTVTVTGDGKGGRNLEFALAAVEILRDTNGLTLVTFATDGEDGATDAAGAWVDGVTASYDGLSLDATDYLARNDSYTYFDEIRHLLRPGHTGTNVNDLVLGFAV